MEAAMKVGGIFKFEQIRNGKVIDTWEEKNLIVNEGLNDLLQVHLGAGTQKPSWYVAIFEGNYTPLAADTAAVIAANSTESIAYAEATRPLWDEAAASSQQISNTAAKATFSINATKTIYGAFLISDSAKSGTAGSLFAASKFAVSRSVVDQDQLLVTYTVQATSS